MKHLETYGNFICEKLSNYKIDDIDDYTVKILTTKSKIYGEIYFAYQRNFLGDEIFIAQPEHSEGIIGTIVLNSNLGPKGLFTTTFSDIPEKYQPIFLELKEILKKERPFLFKDKLIDVNKKTGIFEE